MKKNLFIIFVLTIFSSNAQTISLTSSTPTSDGDDQETSVRIGAGAGNGSLSNGGENVFVGYTSGESNTSGRSNTFVGKESGRFNNSGSSNSFFGSGVGISTVIGSKNTFIGSGSGVYNDGDNNTFLGSDTGRFMYGSNNVLIGKSVALGSLKFSSITVNDKLAIDNSNTTEPLIWGDFAADQLKFNGSVSIATQLTPVGYKLAVGGKIIAEELKIQLQGQWPDYVFYSDYKLPTLNEVEKQIKEKGHLKDVPSAQEVKENGIQVGDMARIQQQKIEELTLYIIELNKKLEAQDKKLEDLETKMNNNLITK